jgi:hypothetical protein
LARKNGNEKMKIAYETTLHTIDGEKFTDIFPNRDLAHNHGSYRIQRFPLKYESYTVKEVVIQA